MRQTDIHPPKKQVHAFARHHNQPDGADRWTICKRRHGVFYWVNWCAPKRHPLARYPSQRLKKTVGQWHHRDPSKPGQKPGSCGPFAMKGESPEAVRRTMISIDISVCTWHWPTKNGPANAEPVFCRTGTYLFFLDFRSRFAAKPHFLGQT